MSISYFKENLKKFDHDNIIHFLFDLILRVDLDEVEDFDETKQYVLNQKVYIKDIKGKHHIYKCLVESSTIGLIDDNEWEDIIQSFRKPIVGEETIVAGLDIRQEIIKAEETNQKEFKLKTYGVSDDAYYVIIFHPDLGRLAKTDFQISGQYVVLNDDCVLKNIGDRLVVDLYSKM
jgi:hypothetical protein